MNHHTSRLQPDGTTFPPVTPDPPPPPGYVDPLAGLEDPSPPGDDVRRTPDEATSHVAPDGEAEGEA